MLITITRLTPKQILPAEPVSGSFLSAFFFFFLRNTVHISETHSPVPTAPTCQMKISPFEIKGLIMIKCICLLEWMTHRSTTIHFALHRHWKVYIDLILIMLQVMQVPCGIRIVSIKMKILWSLLTRLHHKIILAHILRFFFFCG